jgi:hypothetical protein
MGSSSGQPAFLRIDVNQEAAGRAAANALVLIQRKFAALY